MQCIWNDETRSEIPVKIEEVPAENTKQPTQSIHDKLLQNKRKRGKTN